MDKAEQELQQEQRLKRMQWIFLITFFLFSAIILRLAQIQIVEGSEFEKVLSSRSLKKDPIPAVRGNIYDRNGKLLVHSRASFTAVFHEPEGIKQQEIVELAKKLEKVLRGMTQSAIVKKLDVGFTWENGQRKNIARNAPKYMEKEIKYDLTPEEIAYLEEHREDLPGVDVVTKSIREYDTKQIAVQTIGYVRPYHVAQNLNSPFYKTEQVHYLPDQLVGLDGIERSYEKELRGKNGYRLYEVAADQSVQRELKKESPIRGQSIYLNIDERVQSETRDFIKDFLPKLRGSISLAAGAKTAYVVAMEVDTGKVVTMVSYPEYDPNVWVHGPDQATYEQMKYSVTNGTIREAPYDVRPLTGPSAEQENNKHPKSIVPSGSVMKPITVLLGLHEGVITPSDQWTDPVTYYYGRGNDRVKNDSGHNYGVLNPVKAIAKSSNTYMARIGEGVAKKEGNRAVSLLEEYYHQFGLGVLTEVDLPSENKGKEDYLVMNKTYGPLAAMVQASFGQQVRATTVQLSQYAATLATKGVRLQPQLVDKIVDEKGSIVLQSKPKVLNKIEQPQAYWDILRNGMVQVTQPGGTSVNAFRGLPYQVAAKTGTSEQDIYVPVTSTNSKGESITKWQKHARVNNGVIIAYAPAYKPKLAVAVVVPEGGYGGRSASNISRAVFQAYDKYVGLR
ncbi:penicillin-binding transpeptidase domain-containing protein [Brevibacillus laterosporus]|uniref:peptidoglycan D,D-transpeptidase FtsI family protein n=1 Tax=Brevibacillus laterosporus TaxID=1465 RepID=UPI002E1C3562|nr:penicillin-binding transpeptidase domain-containing protein [Brevibacillus laterosporus]MED1788627.1 penicillin-binding transpeptidase domain-containing protein [Brevibacillus laterosporus]